MDFKNPGISAARQNLRLLVYIRYIALGGQMVVLGAFSRFYHPESIVLLTWLIAIFFLIVVITHWRAHWHRPIPESEFCLHLLVDMLALTVLLYFSGGATNPFVSYFLVPISIAAITLPKLMTLAVALVAISAYSMLLFLYVPLPAFSPHAAHAASGMNLHFSGMWVNFLLSAVIITYFVVRMADALRAQERELKARQEEQMQNEQLIAIATVAAGAAHELGTPLNTIKLLAEDLLDTSDTKTRTDLATINEQIDICQRTLRSLTGLAGDMAKPVAAADVREYIGDLLDSWQLIRPDAFARIQVSEDAPQILAKFHPAIRQALQNLLNNAADASPERIDIDISWNRELLHMRIRDYGEGMSPAEAEKIGRTVTSSKPGGLGLGLYLTSSSLNRHGGRVGLANAADGGLITSVELSLVEENDYHPGEAQEVAK
ncbi:MAG TPA: histidine kinase [Porticoccaceae bacterium]|nr:histidine kinase [Porticoccaceae bacterium]